MGPGVGANVAVTVVRALTATTHVGLVPANAPLHPAKSEPLGSVAGTAASVFGFTQTVGGALLGTYIGQHFDGTVTPIAIGYVTLGTIVLCCVLIAEKGKLFGVGAQYAPPAKS